MNKKMVKPPGWIAETRNRTIGFASRFWVGK